jgi:hypothetical protein
MSKKKLEEKFGKNTAKALGSVLGVTKKDYSGQGVPRSKRFKDAMADVAQAAAVGYTLGGTKPAVLIPGSVLASKVIGTRRAIRQGQKMKKTSTENKKLAEAVDHIINKNYDLANNLLEQEITDVLKSKLHEMKKIVAAHQFNEAVVWPDGKVHTATGEMILPSIWRQRRGLTESNVERERFGKEAKKTLGAEESYGDMRDAEINAATLGGEKIRDYKERKDDYFRRAAGKAVNEKGTDVTTAAKHMHSLVSGVENKKQPWIHMTGSSWEKLHPSVRTDFENHIRAHLNEKEKMKDPKYVERMAKSARIGAEAKKRIEDLQAQEKRAIAQHERGKAGIKDPEPNKPIDWKKKIGDEIPFKE